jgi:hypothetical protein
METDYSQAKDPQTDMNYTLLDGESAHIPLPPLHKVSVPQFRHRTTTDNQKKSIDQDLFDTAVPDKDLDVPIDGEISADCKILPKT